MHRTLLKLNKDIFTASSPSHLLGHCAEKCSRKYWRNNFNTTGPKCGVSACKDATSDDEPVPSPSHRLGRDRGPDAGGRPSRRGDALGASLQPHGHS